MRRELRRWFEAREIQIDRGGSVGVLIAVLAITMLAISPAAGALIDDTSAPQQQTTLPDGNTTTAPENATTTSAATADSDGAESSGNSTASESNSSSLEVRFQFPDQTTNGTRIEVVAPRLPNGGFLVVHGSSFPNNGIGSTIGVSEYIAPNSSYSRVEVRLFDVPGRTFDQQRLRSPTTLYVRAALDTNDNRQYDYLATAGAQDVGYVVDGRQAVLSAEITVNQTGTSVDPASRYGVDAGSGLNGSTNTSGGSQSQSGARSSSGNSSTESSSGFFDLGGNSNPVGAGNIGGNVSGSNSSSGSGFGSLPQQISDYGPVLVLISAGAIWMYVRHQG